MKVPVVFCIFVSFSIAAKLGITVKQFVSAVQKACKIFGPNERLGQDHILELKKIAPELQFRLPTDNELKDKALGLKSAIGSEDVFTSKEEFVAFLSNVLYESWCLTQKEEIRCRHDPKGCEAQPEYNKKYWGRGYIQVTTKDNYKSFSDAVKDPNIMTNPSLVASEKYAWVSAIQFWKKGNARSKATNCGQALMIVNPPECKASDKTNFKDYQTYYQFAPPYRLKLAQVLATEFGAKDGSSESKAACPQMALSIEQGWNDHCAVPEHRNRSPTCKK
ncbi:hypothetical protein ROZALSC1DRAFT_31526 [Rozella allomycis CSF55]|uniref:Glycoside hydrolase family 19 catalytic domain-containing protein n=1 Tax=Rozella allomycis (strain CSF55) TaxID=988480 RepID=A0A075AV44_ROZAC|nr:hypothetical protein O9G_003178 [Rozella allomycis CSF55]RKP16557.1 hypothetical protein ROZALSC1DRAFT_31526 [Rozella allomycis CSF55]|eukprot:EPZ34098.1 hypothetical protein O9G_003178 [Rozella allomycis CSF55]